MIVVIDDERTFKTVQPVVYLRTVDQALSFLSKLWVVAQRSPIGVLSNRIDELWFDHDLGEDGDATIVAEFIKELEFVGRPVLIQRIFIHSQNPVGAQNLHNILQGCAKEGVYRRGLPELAVPSR